MSQIWSASLPKRLLSVGVYANLLIPVKTDLPYVRKASVALAVLSFSLGPACSARPLPVETFAEGEPRILFVGNSLTYVNDLPAMLANLARQQGRPLQVASVAFPDFALEDHWSEGTARRALERGKWEFVVLQQGPSSLPESRANLEQWSKEFAVLIKSAGATPVLYQVWPQAHRQADTPNSLLSYQNAAQVVRGVLAPVGAAWAISLARQPEIQLYATDGLHATRAGTYLAAITILARLTNLQPLALPPAVPGAALDSVAVRALQRASTEALAQSPARP